MVFFKEFLIAFIPLFVAIDVPAVLPLFLSMTEGMNKRQRLRLINQATATAFSVALLFLVAGQLVFRFLGITDNDFRVGGGIVLLVISIVDLVFPKAGDSRRSPDEDVGLGVVPIGVPLIIGPAALTTILAVMDTHGFLITLLALVANCAIVRMAFRHSPLIVKVMGKAGSRVLAKVASLFMAAIAIRMIRIGITGFWPQTG